MEATGNLTNRELLFCRNYALLGNAAAAARQAGYGGRRVERTGTRLLARPDIQEQIALLRGQGRTQYLDAALTGLQRLAFGEPNDAMRLVSAGDLTDEELAALDLFALAEIRRAKGGGFEMKFFDRTKALTLLLDYIKAADHSGEHPLYQALEKGAQADAREAESRGGEA